MDNKTKETLDNLFGASPPRELKLSYSRISDFYKNGPEALIRKSSLDNEGARIGSLTDDLLFTKMVDSSHFNKLYYIFDGAKPTATLGKLVNLVVENKNGLPSKTEVYELVKKNSYWSNIVDEDKLIKKFDNRQFWDYLRAYYGSKDKTIVGTVDYALAEDLVNILLTHEHSKHIFEDSKHTQTLYQYPIRFEYKGFILRGIMDFVKIDHKKKEITLIDLKTGKDDPEFFTTAFVKHRYDLQEAVYTLAFEHICLDLDLKGYKLKPFEFLYLSRYEKTPIIYEVPKVWHIAAKEGYKLNGRWTKGLDELIDDIKWHWDNKVFDKSKVLHESHGRMTLNSDFITIKI